MHRAHSAGSLPDGRRHTFHRSRANIADGENSGYRGLERQRASAEVRPAEAQRVLGQRGIGQSKTMSVESDLVQPASDRVCADKAEDGAAGYPLSSPVGVVGDGDFGEVMLAVQGTDVRAEAHRDKRVGGS